MIVVSGALALVAALLLALGIAGSGALVHAAIALCALSALLLLAGVARRS